MSKSYIKNKNINVFQLSSKVKSCTKGVGEYADFYEVICEDSVLFPEGGGQPCDTGFINDIAVEQVLRRGNEAVMYVKEPVPIGEEVTQSVNWDRRLDHMQQHSGLKTTLQILCFLKYSEPSRRPIFCRGIIYCFQVST